ncbi:MAG: nickel-binding protein [Nitrososphaeraceae archaeon]
MPTFLDFHSMGKYTEDDLKTSQKEPRNELGVKVLNTFYDLDSGMMFCLVDAPDRHTVERHHSKYGMKCDWIT